MAKNSVIGFRCSEQWFKDLADYLTKEGISKTELFEKLLYILFVAMSRDEMKDFTTRGKFDRSTQFLIETLSKTK